MDYKKQVLTALKPKVKAFGFDKNELESVAAQIANNLNLAEDASEDDIQTAIDTAVDAAVPFLKLTQSAVSRIVNAQRSKPNDGEDDDDPSKKTPPPPDKKDDEIPAWAKAIIDSNNSLKEELSAMKAEKTTTSRKARLKELVKDAGSYGESLLRQFSHMNFANDEEFDTYLSEVGEDIKSLNQEFKNAGLKGLGNPPSAPGGGNKNEEVFSDEQIDEVAGLY